MSVSHGTTLSATMARLIVLFIIGQVAVSRTAVAQPATDAQLEGATTQSDLKWKPHRHATATPPATIADAPQLREAPAREASPSRIASTSPTASVALPDRVPATPSASRARAPETAPYAPMRGSLSKGMRQMFTPSQNDPRIERAPAAEISFAERMMRTPQGHTGRPIMDRETGFGMTDPPQPAPRLGGGLAPRYTPANGGSTAQRRGDRIAMNVDGIPSVMTRAPQAAAIDEPRAPSRLSTDAPPAGTLPAPSTKLPAPAAEIVDPPLIIETSPMDMGIEGGMGPAMAGGPGDGMWMGQYPAELHVESFYDDPYACDEEGGEPMRCCDGRICRWMRQFGKPYYGWRWYRDFTASAGVTSFQNATDLGLLGNYGANEYLNWAMPLWNAFGLGWQVGVRGTQTHFQKVTLNDSSGASGLFNANSREQVFVTTGLFTRAFEGRGLQGGAVYDYLRDNYYDNVDLAQLRAELSYVWGYHEFGFWGAFNLGEQTSFAGRVTRTAIAGTEDLYTGFYRIQFGDANELRVWGGATGSTAGVFGSSVRAPMNRSFALEGAFTYLVPGKSQTYEPTPGTFVTTAPSAWNVSLNLVYYPARRARRSLASPYRPLFDVADNGSMIRTLGF